MFESGGIMARYISEEKLIVNLMDYSKGKKTIGQCVTDTPTEDVAPIIRGKWIYSHDVFSRRTCNKCNYSQIIVDGMAM